MTPRKLPAIAPLAARLDWETDHFGVHAAQLTDPTLDEASLERALQQARVQGVQWLVWATDVTRSASPGLLERFAGKLVDRKATFVRPLDSGETIESDHRPDPLRVVEFKASVAPQTLIDLAVASGEYSRFRLDPRLSEERFVAMYRRWIERSVAKELADAVLVAECHDLPESANRTLAGMISVSESRSVGSIGLVAVAAAARGRGIGSALIQTAHQWMIGRGAREARVVTQMANLPACRLYERAGYQLARVQHIYHFWPQAIRPLSDAEYRRAA